MPYDPTRTTSIRRNFVRAVNRRWRELKTDIRMSILDQDCFNILPDVAALSAPANSSALGAFAADPVKAVSLTATSRKQFMFETDAGKVEGFMSWLVGQEQEGVLEMVYRPGQPLKPQPWSNMYIDSAYRQGIRRSYAELHRIGYDPPVPIDMAFTQPVHIQRVEALYLRTFEDLKTVTEATNAQMRRHVIETLNSDLPLAIAEGQSPRVVARQLVRNLFDRVDKVGIVRSRAIARSEIIRAHHKATMTEYRQASEEMEVTIKAELSTAGEGACEVCLALEDGGPYTLRKAEGMIPVHPNCRCAAIPAAESLEKRRVR
jgi:hypothetical protein